MPGTEIVHPGRFPDRIPAKSAPGDEAVMMRRLAEDASHIYLATGTTDFRKQISGLVAIVSMQFKLDPFQDTYDFIFCNKKRESIKGLRYDKNGFLLATKNLLDGMKFQLPRTPDEVKRISFQQVEWLLHGLKIEQEQLGGQLFLFEEAQKLAEELNVGQKKDYGQALYSDTVETWGAGQRCLPACQTKSEANHPAGGEVHRM